jgi:hypothetical protein
MSEATVMMNVHAVTALVPFLLGTQIPSISARSTAEPPALRISAEEAEAVLCILAVRQQRHRMPVFIEENLGKAHPLRCMEDTARLLPAYDEAARLHDKRDKDRLPLWSEALRTALSGNSPPADKGAGRESRAALMPAAPRRAEAAIERARCAESAGLKVVCV